MNIITANGLGKIKILRQISLLLVFTNQTNLSACCIKCASCSDTFNNHFLQLEWWLSINQIPNIRSLSIFNLKFLFNISVVICSSMSVTFHLVWINQKVWINYLGLVGLFGSHFQYHCLFVHWWDRSLLVKNHWIWIYHQVKERCICLHWPNRPNLSRYPVTNHVSFSCSSDFTKYYFSFFI